MGPALDGIYSAGGRLAALPADLLAEDVAILPYSSGTTGVPKGTMLSHRNIIANMLQLEAIDGACAAGCRSQYLWVVPRIPSRSHPTLVAGHHLPLSPAALLCLPCGLAIETHYLLLVSDPPPLVVLGGGRSTQP